MRKDVKESIVSFVSEAKGVFPHDGRRGKFKDVPVVHIPAFECVAQAQLSHSIFDFSWKAFGSTYKRPLISCTRGLILSFSVHMYGGAEWGSDIVDAITIKPHPMSK